MLCAERNAECKPRHVVEPRFNCAPRSSLVAPFSARYWRTNAQTNPLEYIYKRFCHHSIWLFVIRSCDRLDCARQSWDRHMGRVGGGAGKHPGHQDRYDDCLYGLFCFDPCPAAARASRLGDVGEYLEHRSLAEPVSGVDPEFN